jgi:aryl-alcohol dehydrogenase-like predicted oxidoreductase
MKYNLLPNTSVKVSSICLGTMTFGEQNTEAEAHEQLDYAVAEGINFIDTAEMYPVPRDPNTQGKTETYIGTWLKKRKDRDQLVIATKIAGPDASLTHIRNPMGFKKEHLEDAVNKSLQRLQTDYIDLYQLHWPERKNQRFGIRYYPYDTNDTWQDNIKDVLSHLHTLVKAGKIKHIGISNETPWGAMKFLQAAQELKLPRIVSIQNSYSLLNRTFEYGLSEVSHRENIGLLAYSPLAFGLLSGKYHNGTSTEASRLKKYPGFKRYSSENSYKATAAYLDLARKHNISLPQLALAFVNARPFVTATIIGATNVAQLKENISSINIQLSDEIRKGIEEINLIYPDTAP